MRRIAYIVYEDWNHGQSGVSTFIAHLHGLITGEKFGGTLMEIPYSDRAPDSELSGSSEPNEGRSVRETKSRGTNAARASSSVSALRLMSAYLRMLWRDIRMLWARRDQIKSRMFLTNQFGCETLPIAVRAVFPFARLVAIAHTHPSVNERTEHPVRRFVEALCYVSVTDIVFNSHALKTTWSRKLRKKRLKGHVIWHGLEKPSTQHPSDYPHGNNGAVDFIYVARFVHWKGHERLLRAWKIASERSDAHIRLILVGDGPTLPSVIAQARETGITVCDFRTQQHLSGDQIAPWSSGSVCAFGGRSNGADYFNVGDVALLLPTEPEAFGLVLLEAMSRARPIIASRIGGIPEVVVDGETALLVDPDDSEDVANAI